MWHKLQPQHRVQASLCSQAFSRTVRILSLQHQHKPPFAAGLSGFSCCSCWKQTAGLTDCPSSAPVQILATFTKFQLWPPQGSWLTSPGWIQLPCLLQLPLSTTSVSGSGLKCCLPRGQAELKRKKKFLSQGKWAYCKCWGWEWRPSLSYIDIGRKKQYWKCKGNWVKSVFSI